MFIIVRAVMELAKKRIEKNPLTDILSKLTEEQRNRLQAGIMETMNGHEVLGEGKDGQSCLSGQFPPFVSPQSMLLQGLSAYNLITSQSQSSSNSSSMQVDSDTQQDKNSQESTQPQNLPQPFEEPQTSSEVEGNSIMALDDQCKATEDPENDNDLVQSKEEVESSIEINSKPLNEQSCNQEIQSEVKEPTEQALLNDSSPTIKDAGKDQIEIISGIGDGKELDIENDLENIWSGFITRNKKNRVGVDAYLVSGDIIEFFTDYNLNISHRTTIEELSKITPAILGRIILTSQNDTQNSLFKEYITYFSSKSCLGIVQLRPQILLYLLPQSEHSQKAIKTKVDHMIGVIISTSKLLTTDKPKS